MRQFEFDICIPADHPALLGHFPGHPIVPGALLLDEVMATTLQPNGLEITRLKHIKFSSALLPDEHAHVLFEADGEQATFLITSQRDNTNVIIAKGKMLMRRQNNEALD